MPGSPPLSGSLHACLRQIKANSNNLSTITVGGGGALELSGSIPLPFLSTSLSTDAPIKALGYTATQEKAGL